MSTNFNVKLSGGIVDVIAAFIHSFPHFQMVVEWTIWGLCSRRSCVSAFERCRNVPTIWTCSIFVNSNLDGRMFGAYKEEKERSKT